ncbi:DDE superfamily endonuclease CENP B [Schistosoma japonicum]|nr:DDE superfamily endonuclease CENP B [Schistosoma japonicum]
MATDEDLSYSDDAFEGEDKDDTDVINSTETYSDYHQQILFYRNFDSVSGRSLQRPKTRRRRWTQRDMTNAYNAVKYQGMSLRGAATAFNVPESTLRDRVHGRVSLECSRPGPPTFFTYEEEKKMVDHILFMSKIGYPYTRNQVVELAGDMTKAVGRIAPFKYLNPSQAWFYAFLNRWPDLKNFLFGPRSNRKSKGVSGDSIQSYFEQLEKVLNKYGIKDKAEHFWIVDEVSISCENQPPRILPISIQRAQSVSYWNPTVAMLGAANGIGEKIPPFLIYRGDGITSSMMEGSVRGTKFSYSASGWVNSDAFIQWFLKHFRVLVSVRPLILFYDGHLQFVSVRVLERAREDGVFLFPLPPHPAYNHCVENTCFWAFQGYFKKRLDRFFEQNPNQPLLRNNASPVLTHAYEKALQPNNMISLFERLGICPFNNLSSSIGAYLNMTEDYEQTSIAVENIDPYLVNEIVNPYNQWPKLGCTSNYLNYVNPNGDAKDQPTNSSNDLQYPGVTINKLTTYVTDNTQNVLTSNSNMVNCKQNSSILTSHENNFKTQHAVVTQFSSSGRSVTIRLHGPAASAIQPVSLHASEISLSILKKYYFCINKFTYMHEDLSFHQTKDPPSFDTLASSDVDISHEEEVGSEIYNSQLLQSQTPSHTSHYFQVSEAEGDHNAVNGGVIESMDGLEDGEALDFCVVCGQLEPPELSCQPVSDQANVDDLQVIDWAHCDYCNRWVHLNGCCSEGAVIGNNSFMCVVCRNDGTVGSVRSLQQEAVLAKNGTEHEESVDR